MHAQKCPACSSCCVVRARHAAITAACVRRAVACEGCRWSRSSQTATGLPMGMTELTGSYMLKLAPDLRLSRTYSRCQDGAHLPGLHALRHGNETRHQATNISFLGGPTSPTPPAQLLMRPNTPKTTRSLAANQSDQQGTRSGSRRVSHISKMMHHRKHDPKIACMECPEFLGTSPKDEAAAWSLQRRTISYGLPGVCARVCTSTRAVPPYETKSMPASEPCGGCPR